jgi:hypothetical protein
MCAAIADDNMKAIALLKAVEQERLKCASFRIHYEEQRAEEGKTVEQIVEFNKGNIRKEHLPNRIFAGAKSLFLEDCMYRMTSHNAKHVSIVTLEDANAYGADIYDPRMLGLTEMMHHDKDVATCLLYRSRKNFSVSQEDLNGSSVYVVECRDGERNGFTHWKLYIEEPGFHLVKKIVQSAQGRTQIENDYSEKSFLPFPTRTHIYSVHFNKDGKEIVDYDRHITVKDLQIKKTFPPETFTLAGLNPPLNSDVVDYRINRRLGYWDGEKLVDDPVSVSAQELRELMEPKKRGWINYLFMGIGAAMILWALFRIITKRRNIVE